MGERRVMVSINPPEPWKCTGCSWFKLGSISEYCELGFDWPVAPVRDDRPAACIAAEADTETIEDALEWYEFSKVGPADTEKRDRVADALAAVLCGEVHSAGDRKA